MSARPPQILFALSRQTKESFFPRFDQISLPGADVVWQDVTGLNSGNWTKILEERRPTVLVTGWFTPRIPESAVNGTAPQYICHLAGSVRAFVPRGLIERGVLVTNWGTAISHTVAEHAILLVLGALRGMPQWRSCLENSATGAEQAANGLRTRSLRGQRVGLHGFGAIARKTVALLQPFGVTVSAFSSGVPTQVFVKHGTRECASLEELFSTSDVLIECEALTADTRGCVTETLLRRLPLEAVFVNVGRGAVVDEVALGRLAAAGRIRVGLDVFREEPLPGDSLLLSNPETLLSPHIAGPTRDSLPLCGEQAVQNLRHFLAGDLDQLKGVITPEIYDRST